MEELLKMTGLKTVKNKTIDLFKSALMFGRLDSEARKKNVRMFNYCFMGNAVSGSVIYVNSAFKPTIFAEKSN